MKWKVFSAVMCLTLAHAFAATIPLYQNNAVLDYTIPGNPPPTIDATIFDNENSFNVNYNVYSPGVSFFETRNTLNYTNIGTMTVNSPFVSLGGFIFLNPVFGCGFRFDQQTTNLIPRVMSGSFYNPGTIRCDSIIDGNNVINFAGTEFFIVNSIGECVVSATNIASPGTVEVGVNGLMQFTGQNVDLSRSTLVLENLQSLFLGNTVGINAIGGFGVDTNLDWDPSADLGSTFAVSSLPFVLDLTNSTAYVDVQTPSLGLNVIRAVFVQNTSPNVPYNVYIDSLNAGSLGFAAGAAHVGWTSTYVDPTTCNMITNYLYLTDDYVQGANITNLFLVNGVPDNFTFLTSPTPLLVNPTPAGLTTTFSSGAITNPYSYFSGQLIPSTVATNASPTNPSGALTNLPGRIQITGNNELNLNLAQISGQNYLSVTATNQFDFTQGAQIAAPYSDLNLGVTNGFLAVTNLLQSALPNWSGSIQAWSTRWLTVSSNLIGTNVTLVTNDFRVLLVNSSGLGSVSQPQVQNLRLHATNSVVISDVLNVFGSLFMDAQNLTLTTNGCGNGASSLDGELNVESSFILWPSMLPNLRTLTNNGAIRTLNLAQFGSAAPTYVTNVIPGTPAVAATGILSQSGSANVAANDTVTLGSKTYTFVTRLAHTPNQIALSTVSFNGSISNLIAAINGGSGAGTKYSSGTTANAQARAGSLTNHAFTVTAILAGSAGNSIVVGAASVHLAWSVTNTLAGGVNAVPAVTNVTSVGGPYGAFINHGLLSDQGSTIYANYFEDSGIFTNGVGSFLLQSPNALLTNGFLYAGGNVSITATNLVISNMVVQAGRSLTLTASNLLTDSFDPGTTNTVNANVWSVGSTNGTGGNGFALTVLPLSGDLHGTTITNYAPGPNKQVINTWAGLDVGVSTSGYTNNEAVGRVVLDALGANSSFQFKGAGASNALYVDSLVLLDYASYTNHNISGDIPTLAFNNLVIYYADATIADGMDVSDKLNHKNGDHLRWVPQYMGYFSSTNLVYPGGVTNTVNLGLAQSTTLDSNGNGIKNASDSAPVFEPSQWDVSVVTTNIPPLTALITWHSIPGATNYVQFSTNMATWQSLTTITNSSVVPPVGGWPITNSVSEPVVYPIEFYRVWVYPNTTLLYGPGF